MIGVMVEVTVDTEVFRIEAQAESVHAAVGLAEERSSG
jgi:hypothetical protein